MKPDRHIKKLLRLMSEVRNEVAAMDAEGHFGQYGFKGLGEVETDIETIIKDVERKELLQGKRTMG